MITETPFLCPPIRTSIQAHSTSCEFTDRNWLGWTYRFGQVERNDVEAARWYRAAAEQGHAHAQFTLSAMHVAGEGVPKDVSEAVRWYRLAAEQSEASPWMQLAIMYAIGYEVEPDHTEAARWFREGIAISHHKRGRMLHSRGDYVDAARWLRAAAQQGETQSQWYIGRMYREGEGVPADYVTSYAWLDVASQDRANIPALERDHLATRMTTRQIADARRMARELRERIEADSR